MKEGFEPPATLACERLVEGSSNVGRKVAVAGASIRCGVCKTACLEKSPQGSNDTGHDCC